MDEEKRPIDGLEHIAKEAAEKAQFDFNPEAWKAMEAKLDSADRTPFAWWKLLFPIGALLVLLLIFWPGAGESNQLPEQVETPQETETASPNSEQIPVKDEIFDTESSQTVSPPTEEKRETVPPQNITNAEPGDSPRSTASKSERFVESTEVSSQGTGSRNNAISNSQPFTVEFAQTPEWIPSTRAFLGVPEVFFRKDSFGTLPVTEEKVKRGGAWIFFGAADFSSVGSEGSSDPGTMFGVLRESYVGKHWSFSFGLGYAVKKYSALGADYETPYWARNNPDAVESIIANCLVIDIPLNVRRYFDAKNGNKFFVSSGISSYFMVRETYDYTYDQPRPGWNSTWEIRNENQHLFGIANFSVGYETPIGKNLGLGIEPFVQVPLSGIGFGQVDLFSFGVKAAIKINK